MAFDLNNLPSFDDDGDAPAAGARGGGGLPDLNFPAGDDDDDDEDDEDPVYAEDFHVTLGEGSLISKVLPAIVASWPLEHRRETIWIQQDNARTHIEQNDEAFQHAVAQTGLDIRIFNQPPNSPDLNVLDLGFFASLQSKTFLTNSRNLDELIQNVQNEYANYDASLLRRVYLTLQSCMIEIMKVAGGNGYKIPHMNKDGLEMAGTLPTALNVDHELYHIVMQSLS